MKSIIDISDTLPPGVLVLRSIIVVFDMFSEAVYLSYLRFWQYSLIWMNDSIITSIMLKMMHPNIMKIMAQPALIFLLESMTESVRKNNKQATVKTQTSFRISWKLVFLNSKGLTDMM